MRVLAVIGTAGRQGGLTARHWNIMRLVAARVYAGGFDGLVSGGAAWADHVAVDLFLRPITDRPMLDLCLPAVPVGGGFEDSGVRDWRSNPGGTANHYHRKFSRRLWGDPDRSLGEIDEALGRLGCNSSFREGFHARNELVAMRANAMLAFTMAKGPTPADGGTKHTWSLFRGPKLHVPLGVVERCVRVVEPIEVSRACRKVCGFGMDGLDLRSDWCG